MASKNKTIFNTIDLGIDSKSLLKLKEKKFTEILKKSKKPMFILGQGAMCAEDSESIFNFSLMVYHKYSKNDEWNGFNVFKIMLVELGALDLGFFNKKM